VTEYAGLAQANAFGGGSSGTGTGTRASSGVVTTTATNELVFGAGYTASAFTAPGSGFTLRALTQPDADIVEDMVASAPGAYAATATTSSGAWVMQVAAFRAAASLNLIPPQIAAWTFSSNQSFVVSFDTVLGQNYELQSTADLASGAWVSVATDIAGTGSIVQATDTNSMSQVRQFYRVKTGM